ncbi:MAG: DUF2339 domain-containing protein [Bacteroidota bacterium]|nr:DUF2339 domain-containing protein [Bacteroidota bacterium]
MNFNETGRTVISLVISSVLMRKEERVNIVDEWSTIDYRRFLNVTAVFLLFLTGFMEMRYNIQLREVADDAYIIYCSVYTGLFALALYIVSRPLKLNYLFNPLAIIGSLLMIAYGVFPHIATIDARNYSLMYGDGNTAFRFHYIYAVVIIAFSFLIYHFLNKEEKYSKGVKDIFLWLMCFTLVFIASAEVDHSYIMSQFSGRDLLNPENGMGEIKQLASQSHKIGFPILWGISSFIMIVIGMRKNIRQLRIIALVLFAVTIIKLILLGIYGESQTGKIIAFIISGVILLLVSFLYQKLKKLVLEQDRPTEKNDSDEKTG